MCYFYLSGQQKHPLIECGRKFSLRNSVHCAWAEVNVVACFGRSLADDSDVTEGSVTPVIGWIFRGARWSNKMNTIKWMGEITSYWYNDSPSKWIRCHRNGGFIRLLLSLQLPFIIWAFQLCYKMKPKWVSIEVSKRESIDEIRTASVIYFHW